jgi:hypothetical protein
LLGVERGPDLLHVGLARGRAVRYRWYRCAHLSTLSCACYLVIIAAFLLASKRLITWRIASLQAARPALLYY